jgi:ascorbate-specific PTS system EIIC-type component UlaA
MSEEKKEGFFSQIKNQIVATIGIVITAGGGLLVTNMEAIFNPTEEPPMMEQTISVPKNSIKDTLVITKTIIQPVVKPKVEKKKEVEETMDW